MSLHTRTSQQRRPSTESFSVTSLSHGVVSARTLAKEWDTSLVVEGQDGPYFVAQDGRQANEDEHQDAKPRVPADTGINKFPSPPCR